VSKGGSTVPQKERETTMEKVDLLESLIVERLKEVASRCSPGNSWVLGTNNNTPEMIAKEVVALIKSIDYK